MYPVDPVFHESEVDHEVVVGVVYEVVVLVEATGIGAMTDGSKPKSSEVSTVGTVTVGVDGTTTVGISIVGAVRLRVGRVGTVIFGISIVGAVRLRVGAVRLRVGRSMVGAVTLRVGR